MLPPLLDGEGWGEVKTRETDCPLQRSIYSATTTAKALQIRRTQQTAQGQRPHAVGTQKSVVSPTRFAARKWVVSSRSKCASR